VAATRQLPHCQTAIARDKLPLTKKNAASDLVRWLMSLPKLLPLVLLLQLLPLPLLLLQVRLLSPPPLLMLGLFVFVVAKKHTRVAKQPQLCLPRGPCCSMLGHSCCCC